MKIKRKFYKMKKPAFSESENNGLINSCWLISRRDFLKASAIATANFFAYSGCGISSNEIRFGILTDSHYADRETQGNRFYKESLQKMRECVNKMNEEKVDFLIELGDFKDQDTPPSEQSTISYLQTIESEFAKFRGKKYHVLGNHDVDSISKEQFQSIVQNTNINEKATYYSFDLNGFHFIILDANYRSNGIDYSKGNFDWTDANIPPVELEWLEQDLVKTQNPSIVFIHQLLDGAGDLYVRNAAEVRQILQKPKKVLLVFQGHHHAGDYNFIEGIHYYTLKAMVEGSGADNNSYALVDIDSDLNITITGYRKAVSMDLQDRQLKSY